MLCAKCHQNEATIHFITVVGGAQDESVHLCPDCAPPTEFNMEKLDLKEIEALSVIGKKCEFCGKDAFSGEMGARGGAIYWCFDCGPEVGRMLSDFNLQGEELGALLRHMALQTVEPDGAANGSRPFYPF